MATDSFGRNIHYLRVSLTDKCNLRCVYCMPEDMKFRPKAELMQDDEVLTFVKLFASLGFDKYRLTGGEPTIRENIVDIVGGMKSIEGVEHIALTTNGILLDKLAEPLAQAGVDRVNISLDTLDAVKFKRITRWGSLDEVWAGVEASERAGLTPIKINAVVVRGFNDEDVVDLARLTIKQPWQMRFIEMMPFGEVTGFAQSQVVTTAEIQERIQTELGELTLLNGGRLDGEAQIYQLHNAQGTLGFISPITHPFCASCTRARLTADGVLRLCLLKDKEVDLLTPLRAGASLEELRQMILDGVWHKPWGHQLDENIIPVNRVMSQIGG